MLVITRRQIVVLGISLICLAGAWAVLAFAANAPSTDGGYIETVNGREVRTCQEDDPCWDWRTMGNRERGVCVDGRNMLEHANGSMRPGGRGCQSVPLDDRCDAAFETVTKRLSLPVGWVFSCPEGRNMTSGSVDFNQKLIKIGDAAGDGDDLRLRFVIAHELCHVKLTYDGNPTQRSHGPANERAADTCAAQHGFPNPEVSA